MDIKQASIACDLSRVALEDAVRHLPPAWIYDLHVSPDALVYARGLLKEMAMEVPKENPLAPHFALHLNPAIARYAWSLHAGGSWYWSPGA